jgi:Magnesium chelatase, subunit ChlI
MTLAEALETTRIHRVAGLTGDRTALVTTRPFRAPHLTISDAGLFDGRLVKTSPGLLASKKLAIASPVDGQAGGIFYRQRRGPALVLGEVSGAHHRARFPDALRPS